VQEKTYETGNPSLPIQRKYHVKFRSKMHNFQIKFQTMMKQTNYAGVAGK